MPEPHPAPNAFTAALLEKLRRHPKRIVFPEGDDPRVLEAAAELVRREAILPILLGDRAALKARAAGLGLSMGFVNIIDPATSSDLELFNQRYIRMQAIRGIEIKDGRGIISKPHQFAAMMVQYGQADAVVAGNLQHPAVGIRALQQLIKPMPGVPALFGAVVLVDGSGTENERVLVLADCAVHVEPDPEHLAAIAVESGKLARHILGRRARVALLSHSTKGSVPSVSSRRVEAATALAKDHAAAEALDMDIEGEIQADAALVPAIAEKKSASSLLHGEADVLVFPSLDAADISLRLLRHLGNFHTYGQLVLGLARPAAQLPRSATVEQIVGTAAAAGVEAIKYHDLYPHGVSPGEEW
jgi:phosphate acetyltransferase